MIDLIRGNSDAWTDISNLLGTEGEPLTLGAVLGQPAAPLALQVPAIGTLPGQAGEPLPEPMAGLPAQSGTPLAAALGAAGANVGVSAPAGQPAPSVSAGLAALYAGAAAARKADAVGPGLGETQTAAQPAPAAREADAAGFGEVQAAAQPAPAALSNGWGGAPSGFNEAYTVPLSGDANIDALLRGTKWGSGTPGQGVTLTYSFRTPSTVGISPGVDAYAKAPWFLSDGAKDAMRSALAQWAAVANIHFVEVPDTAAAHGDIRIGGTYNLNPGLLAESNMPQPGFQDFDGDIWLGSQLQRDSQTPATDFAPGTVGYMTLLHEIGHALGLKHPFARGGDNTTVLPDALDTERNTVMSYNYQFDSQSSTPQAFDIAAIQYLYGANTANNSGDTVYHFDPSRPAFASVWDASGINTIDASNQTMPVALDLNPGARSYIGAVSINNNPGQDYLLRSSDYLTLAQGTTIQNAVGTRYDDIIRGNAADNRLEGGAGFDFIQGGAGWDTAVFRAPAEAIAGMRVSDDRYGRIVRHITTASGRPLYDFWFGPGARLYVADVRTAEDIPAGQTSQGIDCLEGVEQIAIEPIEGSSAGA